MENEQIFEAEADVDQLSKLRSRSSQQAEHEGRDALQAALGGIDTSRYKPSENTPLLSQEGAADHGTDSENGNEEIPQREPPKWSGERDFEGMPWWKIPSIFWLLPPFALFSLSFGGIIVPKLNLILGLVCEEYFSERSRKDATFHMTPVMPGGENPQCRIPEVQALVSKFTLYANLITGLLAAVTSPKLGELSDRYGRVPMMSLTTLGLLVSELITILVATCPDTFSVNWILLGYFFDGIGGSFIAAMALSYAYASDCTAPDKRNVVFGYYHGCLFGGIALGPIFAGYIVKLTGDILTVFYIAIASHCAFFLFLMFVVPESLTKARQRAAREKRVAANKDRQRLNVWRASDLKIAISFLLQGGGLLAPLKVLWPTGPGTNPAVRRNLFCLAAVDMIMFGVAMGSMTVVLIYSEFIFGWDNFQTSLFVSIVNIGRVTVLLLVLPALSRLVRGPQSKREQRISGSDTFEIYIIRVAIFFDLLGYLGYATVRTGPLFILSGLIASFGGMGSPTLQAALTKHVPPEQTGQVLGAVGLLHASARVVAPTVFNLIYAETVGKFTQTVFVCLGATFGVAFIISWFIRPHVYWDQPPPDVDGEDQAFIPGHRE